MPMDPGTSVLLNFTDIESCCLFITEVAERMDTNQYDLTIIKIGYCQDTFMINNKQTINKMQKEKITNIYTLQRSIRIHLINKKNIQDNNNTQNSRERYICTKDRMYMK